MFVHGIRGCKADGSMLLPSGMLAKAGFNVIVFDLRDHGESSIDDNRVSGGQDEWVDVITVFDWLIEEQGADPDKIGIYGNSMGAGTAAIAFTFDTRIQSVWLESGYSDMGDIVVEELEFQGYPTFLGGAGIFAGKIIANQNFNQLMILIASSVILILFFEKLKVPAPLLAGTLVASGLLQITEVASYQISPDIIDYCLLILGSSVGCRFADKTFKEIGRNALHSFVATFLLVILGITAAVVAGLVIDKNFFTLLLSYCPGGIYEVAVIAIFFDLDPEFVSFHHIIRLLMILFIVPIILRFLKKT